MSNRMCVRTGVAVIGNVSDMFEVVGLENEDDRVEQEFNVGSSLMLTLLEGVDELNDDDSVRVVVSVCDSVWA